MLTLHHLQNTYQGKRILITGAGGYIGSHLVKALSIVDCHIVRMSRKKLAQDKNSVATIEDIQADLLSFDDWPNLFLKVDIIFHLAAQTGIKDADDFPVRDAEINILSFLKILDAAKSAGNKIVILAGSAAQCGLQDKLPVNENVVDLPLTLYDLNKLIAEKYLRYFTEKNWIRGTCLRLANVYGPGIHSSNNSRGVLNRVIENALSGKEIITFGGGDFIRDYIYVLDVVAALILSAAHIENLNKPYYVIGSGEGITIKKAFDLVAACVKQKTGVTVMQSNQGVPEDFSSVDRRHFIADSREFSNIAQWKPEYSLENGINETITAYQKQ